MTAQTQRRVLELCADRRETLATCESLTAGLLSATLAQVPGASAVLRGGLVTYATELKHSLAGVPHELLDSRGAVDPDVAQAMADGARRVCASDWAVSLTGVAGPEPQDGKPVGLVYAACAGPAGLSLVRELHLSGDREQIRVAACDEAMSLLCRALENAPKCDIDCL